MIQTDHYPLLKSNELFDSLADCELFCVLYLSGAYQQLNVSENCKDYLTINTLKGLIRKTTVWSV